MKCDAHRALSGIMPVSTERKDKKNEKLNITPYSKTEYILYKYIYIRLSKVSSRTNGHYLFLKLQRPRHKAQKL